MERFLYTLKNISFYPFKDLKTFLLQVSFNILHTVNTVYWLPIDLMLVDKSRLKNTRPSDTNDRESKDDDCFDEKKRMQVSMNCELPNFIKPHEIQNQQFEFFLSM